MDDHSAPSTSPYHAHIYYPLDRREQAVDLQERLISLIRSAEQPQLLYVGQLRDHKVGPHPIPQFEIHFTKDGLAAMLPVLQASGFSVLVHPLTDDDVADHTSLAHWIGTPVELDLAPLDPPGMNKGVARFAKTDF